jgi:hypothetical protein
MDVEYVLLLIAWKAFRVDGGKVVLVAIRKLSEISPSKNTI